MERAFFAYVWQHSRKEQVIVLLLVALSLPTYWLSLDLPKQIVNDAIQGKAFAAGVEEIVALRWTIQLPAFLGGQTLAVFEGVTANQVQYLYLLSFAFLFFTLVNGGFKYFINIRKGVLGERLLRRLRFDLFSRVMRFKPEALRTTKSAEISSMIKDEVEPIGGFFGDSFITPVFLATQALTALLFIFMQDFLLGFLTACILAVQALIIPRLRREQLRLGRLRQLESRKLAGRVSEMVDSATLFRNHGVIPFYAAEIGDRLGLLFRIRFDLYRRKFSVKYLNNLLAQVTPFLFYTLGGYLALNGKLDIGQLVAVIAAYRDLPTPVKELIDWDQQRADAIVKFEQVIKAFSRDLLPEETPREEVQAVLTDGKGPIRLSGLRYIDRRGTLLLDQLTTTIDRPVHLALVGPPSSGSLVLPKVLGGQVSDFTGGIWIGDRMLGPLTEPTTSHISYQGSDPAILSGTIRENIVLGARRGTAPPNNALRSLDEHEQREAIRTGNPGYSAAQDWFDYGRLGIDGPAQLDMLVVEALKVVGGFDSVFLAGLRGPVGDNVEPDMCVRLVDARMALQDRLESLGLAPLVEVFEASRYNSLATIRENLLFGSPVGPRFSEENLVRDPYVRSVLSAESLAEPLVLIGLKIAETVLDVMASIRPGSALLDRYAAFDLSDPEALQRDCEEIRLRGFSAASHGARQNLTRLAMNYVEPKHRLGLIDEAFRARLLRARISFRMFLSTAAQGSISFYDRGSVIPAMSIEDNLLFGRIGTHIAGACERLEATLQTILEESGLDRFVVQQGLGREVGPGGRLLTPEQRATIALARSILVKPDILVLDQAFSAFTPRDAAQIRQNILRNSSGRTLIVTLGDDEPLDGFERALVFEGPRVVADKRLPETEQGGGLKDNQAAE